MIAGVGGARLGSAYSDGRRDGSQGRRHLQFCRENEHASRALLFVSAATKSVPPPPLTRRSTAFRDPDTRPSIRLFGRVLDRRVTKKEIIMTMFNLSRSRQIACWQLWFRGLNLSSDAGPERLWHSGFWTPKTQIIAGMHGAKNAGSVLMTASKMTTWSSIGCAFSGGSMANGSSR
jgi:hypothetical protein